MQFFLGALRVKSKFIDFFQMQYNFTFVMKPRQIRNLQTPLDDLCAEEIKSALNGDEGLYRDKFSVLVTDTCPGVQLHSSKLTFQEPVSFCSNGEPVYSMNRTVSCLESTGMLPFLGNK